MNLKYYLVRTDDKEMRYVYVSPGLLEGKNVEHITKVEFETYREFGIKAYAHCKVPGAMATDITKLEMGVPVITRYRI